MLNINPQRPFAFQQTPPRRRQVLKHKPQLSYNIAGVCTYCGKLYQKVRRFDKLGNKLPCTYCRLCATKGYNQIVVEFPKTLRPWKIIIQGKSPYIKGHQAFICQGKCGLRLFSWAVLGAMCDHKTHTPPNGWVCRLCCHKQVEIVAPPVVEVDTLVDYDNLHAALAAFNQQVRYGGFQVWDNDGINAAGQIPVAGQMVQEPIFYAPNFYDPNPNIEQEIDNFLAQPVDIDDDYAGEE